MKYLKKLDIKLVKGEYQNKIKGQVRSPEQIYDVFESIKDKAQETLIVLYLDKNLEVKVYSILSTGSKNETTIDFDDVYGYGFLMKAKYFILIHNHPSGEAKPSDDDKEIIKTLQDYLEIKRVKLKPLDFIIVGDMEIDKKNKKYWSMFEEMDGGEYSLGAIE